MPLLTKKRVLAAKIETTPGTAISLSASDAVFNVFDPNFSANIDVHDREGQSAFSRLPATLGAYAGQVTFTVELIPGSSAHPAWASTFLPACGFVASSQVYSPATEAPGSNVKTLTIGGYQDGRYRQLHGCVGNAVFRFVAGERVLIDFTFVGIWSTPSDVAIIAPTYPTLKPMRFVSSGLTIGAWSPKVREVTIDLGNETMLREDSSTSTGFSTGLIVGRRVNGTLTPEAELVATKDYYGEWLSNTEQALAIVLSSSNLGFTFGVPKLQFTNIQQGDRNGVAIDEITWQGNRSAAAGNDELTITLDITP